jgi:hypothetical protein
MFTTSNPLNQPMVGVEGITYTTSLTTKHGRVGFRSIGGDRFRVRVEPANGNVFTFPSNWKTPEKPGRNPRYSTVVTGQAELASAIALGAAVLTGGDTTPYREPFKAEVAGVAVEEFEGSLMVGDQEFEPSEVPALIETLQKFLAVAA